MLEVGTISAYKLGWLNIWNGLDVCTYLLQVCAPRPLDEPPVPDGV